MNDFTLLAIMILLSIIFTCKIKYSLQVETRKPKKKKKTKKTKRELLADKYLEKYMKKHKLLENGWKYEISKRITSAGGYTYYHKKTIRMGYKYVQRATVKELKDSILHEVAHALVGSKVQSHGKVWKSKAISIGCSGNRCHYTNMN